MSNELSFFDIQHEDESKLANQFVELMNGEYHYNEKHRELMEIQWNNFLKNYSKNKTDKLNFLKKIQSQEECSSMLCELFLVNSFASAGYNLAPPPLEGYPDICLIKGEKKIWIEVTRSNSGNKNHGVPSIESLEGISDMYEIDDLIKLRIANSIKSKKDQYNRFLKEGIVSENDLYIIALCSPFQYPDFPGEPRVVRTVFSMGKPVITLNASTLEKMGEYWDDQSTVEKKENVEIEIGHFSPERKGDYDWLSGILFFGDINFHSFLESFDGLNSTFFVHNSYSKNPLLKNSFKVAKEFSLENNIVVNN